MHSRIPFHGVTLIAFGTLLGVSSGEALLRLYSAFGTGQLAADLGQWDPYAVRIEPHGQVGYRQKPGSVIHYRNGTIASSNTMGFRGPPVPLKPNPSTFRIVLLGGSTTHGWGVHDDQTIDAYMRMLWAQSSANHELEVINLAFDGYDSYQLLERLGSDGLRLKPDVIIVNSGINDVRNARYTQLHDGDPRTLLWGSNLRRLRNEQKRGGPSLWTRIKHYSLLARLPGIVRQRVSYGREQLWETARQDPHLDAADYFQRNLQRIAKLAHDNGISVLFSTPPSALRTNYHPHETSARSYWIGDAATTQAYRDTLSQRMQNLVAQLQQEGWSTFYVPHTIPSDLFADDAHLTPEGNRQLAENFLTALEHLVSPDRRSDRGPTWE